MSNLPRILFVDDEPNVLLGLRRMLRHKRESWSMEFAEGGAQALALMAASPPDVLVTDMRMPGMDGAELLARASASFPDCVRFILSGQSDSDSLFRAIGCCHQYLSKPMTGEVLVTRIERSLALRRMMGNPSLRRAISGMPAIPSLPEMYAALVAELQSGYPRLDRIEAIVGRDPGLAAKLLQIANSAYFARVREVHSLKAAINFLGLDLIKALVAGLAVVSRLRCTAIAGRPIDAFIEDSLRVAQLARRICEAAGLEADASSDAFTAGLLHKVGLLILADNYPEKLAEVLAAPSAERSARERDVFGASQAEIGACILGTWGFFDGVVESVLHHGDPPLPLPDTLDVPAALRCAHTLTGAADDPALAQAMTTALLRRLPDLDEALVLPRVAA
jgi:HD-like signal output (HDOD) protein/ActR/RegA family two-component response regulator